jgi:hypothetical protein
MGRLLALGILGTLACAPVAAAQNGSVTGTMTTSARGSAPIRVTIDQKVCGTELPDEAIAVTAQGRLANAVVILTGVKKAATYESMVMNEKCRFAPRVQLARPNSTVKTSSKDPVLHTTQVQLENGRTVFNVGIPVPGITISKTIGGAGVLRLTCNTHPWMRGWMVVTDEAAAISGADGGFAIDAVPPGTYEARVWHESLKGAPQKITVVAGKPTVINFELK